MSADQRPLVHPAGGAAAAAGAGLLRGHRARSYGSLVRSGPAAPVPREVLQHRVQPWRDPARPGAETEQIMRANRLYTNDSIFLRKVLFIPALLSDPEAGSGPGSPEEDSGELATCVSAANKGRSVTIQGCAEDQGSDLSPMDFLQRMDSLIRQSKNAAVQGCHDGEKRFAAIEAACNIRVPERRCLTRSQSAISSQALNQQMSLVAVPLTVTKRTKTIRAREDEIFEL
ncbi:LysM and putative peptidoglycan-binding domain-containing protein 1 [Merluccius polli]|uniref:LysM and putative peptidoglycan-binding domain-containing protein 1 n=1 Tax=Merluccius polli TaxID=89951 RepID=A0AA47N6K0_MERPO|nr:LysM and putative peptidoglycan-binding domain-containing protein 1 [Merluccius polli]